MSGDWRIALRMRGGKPEASLANAIYALENAPEIAGKIGFNESKFQTEAIGELPWACRRPIPRPMTDDDDIEAANWAQHHEIAISPLVASQAIQVVAKKRSHHPIRAYLSRVQREWDGDKRIDCFTSDYLGVRSSEYASAVGARFLIGAVARIMRPGCKLDTALILEGPQGALKSTALRVLAEPWFSDEMTDIGSKDAQLQIRGVWIVEWSELDSMSRVDVAKVKAFMSRQVDRFRPPYGRRLVEVAREATFAGTTNSDSYLRDETGGRRFWPLRCGKIDIARLREDRDQLWAEAVERFNTGSPWWLNTPELEAAAAAEQSQRYESGVWDGLIQAWVVDRESVTVDEILRDCLIIEAGKRTQAHMNHVVRALRRLGWSKHYARVSRARQWRYFAPGTWPGDGRVEAHQTLTGLND